MKKIITTLLLCFSQILISQSKDFIIIDKATNLPIDLAQVMYPSSEIGSVTNEDGRIRIPLLKDEILISHINYNERKLQFKTFQKKDTIFLTPRSTSLDEIVLYNIKLKEKIANILDKTYLKKYSTKKAIHNSTYKETFSINDSLNRLFQIQMNWYSKNSLFKSGKRIDKQNIFNLEAADYSKIKKVKKGFVDASGAHVENESFFRFLHLNYLLTMLKKYTVDYEIVSVNKNKTSVSVMFNATLKLKGKEIYKHKNSLLVFDDDYNSIKFLKFKMAYNTGFEEDISKESKIKYQKKVTNHIIELSFKKLKNDKLSISYFTSELLGVIKTNKFSNIISAKQSLFVTETKLKQKLKNGNIDINKAFYKSIPNNVKTQEVKFLLTEEEKQFLENSN